MKAVLLRRDIFMMLAITALVILVSAPVYTYRIMNPTDNDYGTHIQFALDLLKHQPVPAYTLAHPMIQVLLIGILWITRGRVGLWVGLIAMQVAAQVLTALILYLWFGQGIRTPAWARAFWAVTLTLAAPVMALVPIDGHYYFGYVGLASYHNPTIHLLRPFALVSFILAVRALEGPRSAVQARLTEPERFRSPIWMVLASAAIIVLSALIKPNYALVILPAMALLIGIRLLRNYPGTLSLITQIGQITLIRKFFTNKPYQRNQENQRNQRLNDLCTGSTMPDKESRFSGCADWRMVLVGFVIPACLVLAVQGIVTYADGGSVAIQPFVVEASYSGYLPVKFLLSVIFPLGVLAVYFPAIRKSPEMLLAWAAFAFGALQMYLLVENGDRLEHGNFRWSAQIGLFLLFAASARWLLQVPLMSTLKDRVRRSLLIGFAYLPHVAAGVIYYLHAISSKGYG